MTATAGRIGTSGDRLEVDPDALIRDGRELGSLGTQLGMLSDSLGASLADGIASGTDPAGANFGLTYGDLAQSFANGLAMAANALKSVGYMLEATGFNYKNADVASTVGGAGPTGGVGDVPDTTTAADAALGPSVTRTPPPGLWGLVEPLVPIPWPSGVPALMGVTAAQWENYASGFEVVQAQVDGVKTAVSLHVRHLAEGPKINEAMVGLHEGVAALAALASGTADVIKGFAKGVQDAQDAIRRILDRISSSGLIDTVKGLFTGDGLQILREIANEVGAALKYLQSQVKAFVGLLQQLTQAIGDAMTGLQKWVRPRLEEVFGEKVGRNLAAQFTLLSDVNIGMTTGLVNAVAGVVAMADPDTWKGMYDVGMSVLHDPTKLDDVLLTMGREFVAYDSLKSDHPGRGIGEAGFNVISSLNPGGVASKAGMAAKAAERIKGLAEDGKLSKLGDLAKLGAGKNNLDALDSLGGSKAPESVEFTPAPRVPESVIGPRLPDGFGASVGRPGQDGPKGLQESPGARSFHGDGGDGPSDPPARAAGPSESAPGHSAGLSPQPPMGAGPGHPVDSPDSPGPSSGDPVPTSRNYDPDSYSTASDPETLTTPGLQKSAHATPEYVQPQATHQSPNSEPYNSGHLSGNQGHSPGVREDAGRGPFANHMSNDTHPAASPEPLLNQQPDGQAPDSPHSPHHPGEPSDDPLAPGTPTDSDAVDPDDFAAEHPPLHREDPYPVQYMPGMFDNETDPNHSPFLGQSVERWPPEEIEQHRIVVDQNGLLRHIDGRLFDTRDAILWNREGGKAIFTMDPQGNIYASLEQEVGRIHHSTLSSGRPVAGAGELAVIDGRLKEVTGNSGHYRPLRSNTQNVLDELESRGVDLSSVSIDWIAPEGT
ncbi:phage tail family protein [Mycolicibacterium neworleansense]|uniref:ADP-ribosyltransferse n=1 Tax=Mycolicibacterium neworleansense TaxID=146018 RepID=A0A0H5RSL0_9MYCO|nr:hypothetical protein [Mycolicibacterium neworleansense]MCV7363266.1 hypothetical protein [Mycolicibacterium neworleansense]CRZ17160.1 ADP-ribosyltransferse [Mycolicibacterium neworleansense]